MKRRYMRHRRHIFELDRRFEMLHHEIDGAVYALNVVLGSLIVLVGIDSQDLSNSKRRGAVYFIQKIQGDDAEQVTVHRAMQWADDI